MLDEHGREIDLDAVDAIGRLPDGRFDVWMSNGVRTIAVDPEAFEVWIRHIRSKTLRSRDEDLDSKVPFHFNRFHRSGGII